MSADGSGSAWVALVLFAVWFLVIFVVRSVMQKRATGDSGIRAGVLADGATKVETLAGWLLVVALVAALSAPIASLAGLDLLFDRDPVRVLGLALAVGGIVLTFAAQVAMGTEWRIGIDKTESTGLVTGGAFALVRNPIFTAMMITAAGFTMLMPNVFAVAGFVLLVVAIELQVRAVEEPHLRRLHGTAYTDYESRVGRFVPLAGRTASTHAD